MNEAIKQMLTRYQPKSSQDYESALKEILQEVILLGLDRGDFFTKAAFYGGTALRILHRLDRFSEDLDFSLLKPDPAFQIDRYFAGLQRELKAFGFTCDLRRVEKNFKTSTESAFLKANTLVLFLNIQGAREFAEKIQSNQVLKIKFEVDTDPAILFDTEISTIMLPSPFTVKALTLPCLFAGKMHAALLRKWKDRVKGRDFYDVQWFLAREIPLKKRYLEEKLKNSGALERPLTRELLIELFEKRVESVDWRMARQDVLRFLTDQHQVALWSPAFFKNLIQKIRLE